MLNSQQHELRIDPETRLEALPEPELSTPSAKPVPLPEWLNRIPFRSMVLQGFWPLLASVAFAFLVWTELFAVQINSREIAAMKAELRAEIVEQGAMNREALIRKTEVQKLPKFASESPVWYQ